MIKLYREEPISLKEAFTDSYNETYTTFPINKEIEETIEAATKRLADHFDFLEGQIIMVGYRDNLGDIKYEYPVIVTKVHKPDINGHNTYDYISFVRGNCEFISTHDEEQRYLWRFCTRSNIPNWFLELMSKNLDDKEFIDNYPNELCFIENGTLFKLKRKSND